MLAPVVVLVYARPNHSLKTIKSLGKNILSDETEVNIYSDAAKNEKTIKKIKLVRNYIDSLQKLNIYKSVKVIKAKSNKGLANSIISEVSEIIERYGKVIVGEDDLVSSPDFLQYMNDSLDYYKKDNEIWSISGYIFNIDIPKDYNSDVYLSYRGSSWGWATWRRT